MNKSVSWIVIVLASVASLSAATISQAEPTVLFFDNFNRPDSTIVGNGWIEESYHNNGNNVNVLDMVSIMDNRMRVTHNVYGTNNDAGLYRPFPRTCGVVVSGSVDWSMGNLAAAAIVGLNTVQSLTSLGLQLQLVPNLNDSHHIIILYNEGVEIQRVPFTFDVTVPYNFEWTVREDCSTVVRVWKANEARPIAPTASSPSVTLVQRNNPLLMVFASGGSGCCSYPGYDVRFDDILVTQAGLTVQIDIKPGSFPNSINLSSAGVIPVAILSTATFDATTMVDPSTLFLAGAKVKVVGKSDKVLCHTEDASGDNLPDLVCQFENEINATVGDSIAVLEGETFDGVPIRGEDSISIVPDK
jgi:hypothetical protein